MGDVAIVTDSSAGLPSALVKRWEIETVSLYYDIGGSGWAAESDLNGDYDEFYAELASAKTPAITAPPTDDDFKAAYERLLQHHRSVVAVCMSSAVSDTCTIARQAATEFGGRVVVIDSAGAGGHLGIQALAAARAAAGGATLDAVVERIRQARQELKSWILVDALDYLRRSDRVGAAVAWLGTVLDIKPILAVEAQLKPIDRVRTRKRGVERLIELMRQRRSLGADRWFVQHLHAAQDAQALVDRLGVLFDSPPEFVSEAGPVLGAHFGPGALLVGGIPGQALR